MNIIFLGPPGVGKGTHAQKVMQDTGMPQISTGDILRRAMKEGTPTGLDAKRYIDAGELVPDEVVIAIVRERLAEKDCQNGYILDGFPRTIPQAEALAAFAKIDKVINLALSDDVIVERLSGRRVCPKCSGTFHVTLVKGDKCPVCDETLVQRKDDSAETVQNRLNVYKSQTAPLIEYYEKKGLVKTVHCVGTLEENYARIREAIETA